MNDRRWRGCEARRTRARGRSGPGALCVAMVGLAAMLTLAGCGQSPKNIAATYVADLQEFNYPACYAMLTEQDRKARTLKQFLGDIPMAPMVDAVWFRAILFSTRYEVGRSHVTADRALVPVKVTMPDLPLWEREIDAGTTSQESAAADADQSLRTGKYPKVSFEDAVVLVKEHHRWRVLADFARRDEIMGRHNEAISLYHSEDWPKTLAEYQKILAALGGKPFTGSRGLEFLFGRELDAVKRIQTEFPAARAYIPKLVPSDVAVKQSSTRVPAIFGRITNAGDRGIDDVRMTLTWYAGRDGKRRVLDQETHSVIVTPIEFTSFTFSVLPFVPGETRSFGFNLVAPPKIQQESEPQLAVSSIIFTQSKAPLPKLPMPKAAASAKPSPAASPSPAHPSATAHSTPLAHPAPTARPTPPPAKGGTASESGREAK
jgi:hypothetical protein